MHAFSLLISSTILYTFFSLSLTGQNIYVDRQLTRNCQGDYSISQRNCSGADGDAYISLSAVSSIATAGDSILIRGGVYKEQLSPMHSGQPDNYIIFTNYQNEMVTISNPDLRPAIWIYEQSYIVIEGLVISDVRRWLNALGSHHLIIKNNHFENAMDPSGSSKTGLFFQGCRRVKILNNTLKTSTQDHLGMVYCDSNLIENNRFIDAEHALWALKCSNHNIITNNYFHNRLQKIGEIYDCDNVGFGIAEYPKIDVADRSKYNVVEKNVFAYTPSPRDRSPYAGIQFAGQKCIIRNNVFYDCEGPPIDLTLYSDEAVNNYGNRIYNNVFYQNEFGGIHLSGITVYQFGDQVFKNNILYKNKFVQKDFRWDWFEELHDQPVQIITGRVSDFLFDHNNIFHSEKDELYHVAYGDRFSSSNPAPQPLSWWESSYSTLFQNNLQQEPEFIDLSTRDFHLRAGSPMIDAGTFLTKTVSSEQQSKQMKVEDATWFTTGNKLKPGDTIQLEGQKGIAVIDAIDYNKNILSLKNALSWKDGQGVSLPYQRIRPDMGAYEFVDNIVNVTPPEITNNSLSVFPNPAADYVQIQHKNFSGIPYAIAMIDIVGKKVLEKTDNYSANIQMDLSKVKKGVYLIIIIENNHITGQNRIVVQ